MVASPPPPPQPMCELRLTSNAILYNRPFGSAQYTEFHAVPLRPAILRAGLRTS